MEPDRTATHHPNVTGVTVDLRANTLRFALDGSLAVDAGLQPATIEIGALGRLLGLELGETYLTVSNPDHASAHLVRTAEVMVLVAEDRQLVTMPRRGDGWELSFPSGNQCWRVGSGSQGRSVCAVVIGGSGAGSA
jgi:hypothetical protein